MCISGLCTPPPDVEQEISLRVSFWNSMISTVLFMEAATSSDFVSLIFFVFSRGSWSTTCHNVFIHSILFERERKSWRVAGPLNSAVFLWHFIILDFLNFSMKTTQMLKRLKRLRKYFFLFDKTFPGCGPLNEPNYQRWMNFPEIRPSHQPENQNSEQNLDEFSMIRQ